ncbi:hypothetical protein LAZ67_1002081, partial [Cordylochernes scorpioides]
MFVNSMLNLSMFNGVDLDSFIREVELKARVGKWDPEVKALLMFEALSPEVRFSLEEMGIRNNSSFESIVSKLNILYPKKARGIRECLKLIESLKQRVGESPMVFKERFLAIRDKVEYRFDYSLVFEIFLENVLDKYREAIVRSEAKSIDKAVSVMATEDSVEHRCSFMKGVCSVEGVEEINSIKGEMKMLSASVNRMKHENEQCIKDLRGEVEKLTKLLGEIKLSPPECRLGHLASDCSRQSSMFANRNTLDNAEIVNIRSYGRDQFGNLPIVEVYINGNMWHLLYDTGSQVSIIDSEKCNVLKENWDDALKTLRIVSVTGHEQTLTRVKTGRVGNENGSELGGIRFWLMSLGDKGYDGILGINDIRRLNIQLPPVRERGNMISLKPEDHDYVDLSCVASEHRPMVSSSIDEKSVRRIENEAVKLPPTEFNRSCECSAGSVNSFRKPTWAERLRVMRKAKETVRQFMSGNSAKKLMNPRPPYTKSFDRGDLVMLAVPKTEGYSNVYGPFLVEARVSDVNFRYQAMVGSDCLYCKYTTCLHSAVRPRVARAPEFFDSGGRKVSRMATNFIRAESPSKAVQRPVRHSVQAQTCAELSAKEDLQRKISNNLSAKQNYANPPTGVKDANLAAARDDVTTGLAAATSSNCAARVLGNCADYTEDQGPGEDDNFTVVKSKKRRRDSPGSPTAATSSSGTRGAGATRRPRSSTGRAPRAEEVRTTQAHIAEARARQASSTEDHCVYAERSPELEPYHYTRAIDRMFGSTREVFQVTKMNGHFLVGLANRGMAERLVNEGLEVEGTLHRAFPFRKRAERITVGNLPFFVGHAAQPSAQPPPPASASPTMEVSDVPPASRAALHPPAALRQSPPAPSALPVEDATPAPPVTPAPSSRTPKGPVGPRPATTHHPEPTLPARPDFAAPRGPPPIQETLKPAALTPDVEMSIVEESSESSTPSTRNATKNDLDAFIERHPSVSFAGTDALGLGREEVLDLLSSRTKAQKHGPLLSPPQGDALAGLIKQILDLRPGGGSNIYKVLGQVKAELRITPAAVPTPPTACASACWADTICSPQRGIDTGYDTSFSTACPDGGRPAASDCRGREKLLPREKAQQCAELSKKEDLQKKASNLFNKNQGYANPPAGGHHANPATPTDFVTASFSEAAAQANRSWADLAEDQGPGEDDNFTVVKSKKRRRDSPGSPTAATSSGTRGAGATRRPRSSTGWAPRAEEVRTTQAHIAEARARQASSTEDHCVYVERSPELEPYHYIRAIDRMFGSTREVFQVTKMNGHFLVGLANKSMAERLVNEGLEVEGTLHRAFPFRKRAERITVGNLPFFVGDAAVISALSSFGRVTSIAPKLMKAGPYVYNDGRREAFIILREGMTIERLPTRLDISIKGEAWPAYLSSGIRCSRCRGQGHRRANCPMLAGRTTAPGPAAPTSPTSVPPATAPRLPQQPSARPPPPASPSSTMEVSDVPPASRAAPLPPAALQPSPPAPSALPLEDTPPAPPPVTPAPSLRTPGSREPAAPTPDVEMSIVEETFASSTSSAKNATRVDLDAFIEELPSVSFAKTDALGLGREEVLDLLSSRTKAQRKGPLLSPPQCDALVGLIGQILDLKPGHTSNLYKVLGQVRAELTKTPAAAPTPPLPAPRPDRPIPPPPHGDTTTPDMATPPPPPSAQMEVDPIDKRCKELQLLTFELMKEFNPKPLPQFYSFELDLVEAVLYPEDREGFLGRFSPGDKKVLAQILDKLSTRDLDSLTLRGLSELRAALPIIRKSRFAERNSNSFEKKSKLCKSARRRPGCKFCRAGRPLSLAAIPTSNAAAQVRRNWADITEEVNPGAEEGFTLVQGRKRRRGSGNSPTTAAPSSNAGASRTIRRPQSSAGSVPRAQEIRATRAHIADARAPQASSSEEHCVYIEHSPELEPFHYLRALDRKLGGTAGVIQITKVNGHQLLGLTNRGLAERLISEGLEVEGTLLRAFPFRKRAERITVGNLPFFVADSAVITALSPFGRVTSIAPKQMKAGPYVYVDGRRDVFITLHEGITIERLPTRLDINIKGQAWPAYLSSGIRCSRCHGQGHRRAICPLLAGLANNTRMAPPTTPAGVPPPTTSAPPQRSAAQPPAPAPSNLAMEVCSAPPMARAVLHPSAPRPSPPAAPALPMKETPSAPPPVIPAPSLQVPKNPVDPRSATPRHPEPTPPARPDFAAPRGPPPIQETLGPAAPTQDVEMSIVEETTASSASSTRNATGVDLVAFIEGNPSVSFAKTDALGLGREEVLDLLSSRTKAQRNGPLLSPPQCDALVGLIGQILDLKPGHTSNLYKVLGQVRAELTKTPAAAPTPPLPAPRPTGPTPPVPHEEQMTEEQED